MNSNQLCRAADTGVVLAARTDEALHHGDRAAHQQGFRLALVIPAWNDENTIRQVIDEAMAALSELTDDFEIIVIDDGSTDRTAEIVRWASALNPRVRLLQHDRRLGHGATLRSGFQATGHDLVAVSDATYRHDLRALQHMLPLTRNYDVVCGYRIDRQEPLRGRIGAWAYSSVIQLLLGTPVRDVNCSLKIFRRGQWPSISPAADDSFANTEMLARAREAGMSIVEVGVQQRPSPSASQSSPLSSWWDMPRTLNALLPFWFARAFAAGSAHRQKIGPHTILALSLLVALAGVLLFGKLSYPLLEPDEGRYAEIGREMLARGDWLLPTLNQEPYLDKPPLFYWLVAGSIGLFGVEEWAARLVPAVSSLLIIVGTFFFGRRLVGSRAALLGSLALSLMVGFVVCGRFVILDSLLTFVLGSAFFCGHEAITDRRLRRGWWLASAFFCGLGFLVKGPVAVALVAPPLAGFGWLARLPGRAGWRAWLAYLGVVLGVILPWFIAISYYRPEFAYHFIVDHHLLRFFGHAYHSSPMWFYLPVLLIGCLPWSLLLLPISRFLFSRQAGVCRLRTPGMAFCFGWAGWCLLFFSLSNGKLPPYILPALPPIALLVGSYLNALLFQGGPATLFQAARQRVPGQTMIVLACAWGVLVLWGLWRGSAATTGCFGKVTELILCLGALAGVIFWGGRMSPRVSWLGCCVLATCMLLELTGNVIPGWAAQHSPLARARDIDVLLQQQDTGIVCFGLQLGSIPFRLCKDDGYLYVPYEDPEAATTFLRAYSQSLIIADCDYPDDEAAQLLPAGVEIARSFRSGRARVFVVRILQGASAPLTTGESRGSRIEDRSSILTLTYSLIRTHFPDQRSSPGSGSHRYRNVGR
jgi:dolichol-phosphate mannosyltransferase